MSDQTVGETESVSEIEDVRCPSRAETDDGAETEIHRQPEDAAGHDAVALRAGDDVFRILRCTRIVEAEEVVAILLRLRMCPTDSRAPARLRSVRPLERREETVIPESLSVRIGN